MPNLELEIYSSMKKFTSLSTSTSFYFTQSTSYVVVQFQYINISIYQIDYFKYTTNCTDSIRLYAATYAS